MGFDMESGRDITGQGCWKQPCLTLWSIDFVEPDNLTSSKHYVELKAN
jgi:hypothetical protein